MAKLGGLTNSAEMRQHGPFTISQVTILHAVGLTGLDSFYQGGPDLRLASSATDPPGCHGRDLVI